MTDFSAALIAQTELALARGDKELARAVFVSAEEAVARIPEPVRYLESHLRLRKLEVQCFLPTAEAA